MADKPTSMNTWLRAETQRLTQERRAVAESLYKRVDRAVAGRHEPLDEETQEALREFRRWARLRSRVDQGGGDLPVEPKRIPPGNPGSGTGSLPIKGPGMNELIRGIVADRARDRQGLFTEGEDD